MKARSTVVLTLVLSLGLLGAACSGGTKRLIPPPPDTVARITTAPPASDYSGVALAPVEGRVLTKAATILGGEAILSGQVTGPDGPVAGATVRLERFVGDAVVRLDLLTSPDGSWQAPSLPSPPTIPIGPSSITTPTVPGELLTIPSTTTTLAPPSITSTTLPPGLLGGRYRIRAWRAPDLALTTPQILFVEAKQRMPIALVLGRYAGVAVSSVSAPDLPVLGGTTSLTVILASPMVDEEGIVRSVPLAGATVSLAVGSGWEFSGVPSITNGQGRAVFQLRCQALGASPLELTVNGNLVFSLVVRACVAPPSTTTTTLVIDPLAPSSTAGFSTTTTR